MKENKPSKLIPPPYGQLFAMYSSFNAMQMTLLNDLLQTDKSIVLSAPTGSGKTVAFELAIVRMLLEADRANSTKDNDDITPKAIYIAPIKALCSERFDNWKARFDTIGINCTQLTGDTQIANLVAIRQAQVVVSTPEKWDSLTRRWRDFENILPAVKLFIIDEVHLLNEDTRGPILEAIVARMKSSGTKRFLVASATIPNAVDLTSWIGSCNINVAQHVFNEMQRPVPLEKHILGTNTKLNGFQFDMKLNYQLPDIIRKYAEGKATLIFCSSRKSAEMAAFNLNNTRPIFQLTNPQKTYLCELAQRLLDAKLRKLVENGIAYHHAGLQYADRNLIESSFREGFLMVLLSTSTLAMGINLPAHLVVIKSTETYMHGGYVEYPESMLLQMIGRAGRPQYDTKGVAVILTQSTKVQKYQKVMNGTAPVESHLHKHLAEHLNSEIAQNSINNLEAAMNWMRSTYLYVRSVRNPIHYGFPANMSKDFVEHKLEELCLKQINSLKDAGLVTIDNVRSLDIQTTAIGKLMAKYYLCFETMKLFRNINGNDTLQNIFDLIVHCKELSEFTLRVNEKKVLNELNKAPIRFPIKGRIKKSDEKISCIMQAVLGNNEIVAPGLLQESLKMLRIVERVSKCLLEYVRLCVQNNSRTNCENKWFNTLLNVYIIAKCFHAKLWENSEYASKQLIGIGATYSSLLHNAGKTTLKAIVKTEARTIERILNKPAPFGDTVLQNLLTFPEYEIKLARKPTDYVQVYAKQTNENYVHKHGTIAVLIVGDSMNNILLLAENFHDILMQYGYFERTIKIRNPNIVEYIYGHIVHTTLVGVDEIFTLQINAPKVTKSQKKAGTTKKQTRLNVKFDNTMNDSVLPKEKSFNEESNVISELMDTSRNVENMLKKFQYTKSKMCHNESVEKSEIDIVINEISTSPKIATIKPLNDTSYMDSTSEINTSNATRLVQRKLTEFFAKRKKTEMIADKTNKIYLAKETDESVCFQNSKQPSTMENGPSVYKESVNNSCSNNAREVMIKHIESTESLHENLNIIENLHSDQIHFPTLKRKASPIDNNFTTDLQPKKKQRFQSDTNKSCPMSLASFLGDIGQGNSITSLVEKENLPPPYTREEKLKKQCSTLKLSENLKRKSSFCLETFPSNSNSRNSNILEHKSSSIHKKSENIQNTAAPLDLSKSINESINPIISQGKCSSLTNFIDDAPVRKLGTATEFTDLSPTDEQFTLWYEVARKFQRLPTQAMSLKNFRYVYNKIIQKNKQIQKPFQTMSTFNLQSCHEAKNTQITESNYHKTLKQSPQKSTHSKETSNSSSSSNSFRLQLLPNKENHISNNIQPTMVKIINQSVMNFVMNAKYKQNQEVVDQSNFDEVLTDALEDLEKELNNN